MKAGYPKQIATTASLFILINSIFGVAGQLTKDIVFDEFLNYWPLFIDSIDRRTNWKFFKYKIFIWQNFSYNNIFISYICSYKNGI